MYYCIGLKFMKYAPLFMLNQNAELKQMTIRIRQGRFSTVTDPNPQILERMHSCML